MPARTVISPSTQSPKRSTKDTLDPRILEKIGCPLDKSALEEKGDRLDCRQCRQSFPVIHGVPILLHPKISPEVDIPQLDRAVLEDVYAKGLEGARNSTIDPYVRKAIAGTNGIMYLSLIGQLSEYPIPEIPLPVGNGRVLLDLGCNWGRWSHAASRLGYEVIGMDPNPEAVFAAYRVAQQLGVTPKFIVGDARFIPIRDTAIDQVYSYSVLQHFARADVKLTLREIHRALKPGGKALIEMANTYGLRSFYHQLRRGFKEGERFDVRYWTPKKLLATWEECIGPSRIFADGYFSLNPQVTDVHLLRREFRAVVRVSTFLKALSEKLPPLSNLADSLFVESTARA